jgi:hypothetical protein
MNISRYLFKVTCKAIADISQHRQAHKSFDKKSGRPQGKIKGFFKLTRRLAATARVDFVADHATPVTAPQKLLWDGKVMRKSDFIVKRKRIFHPNCAHCSVPMWLSQIDDEMPDHQRTFECPQCERVAIRIVKDC